MQHFLCGKLMLFLVGIVALLQVVHLVLLNRLEARHVQNHASQVQVPVPSEEQHEVQPKDEIMEELSALVLYLQWNWVLDSSGEYHVGTLQTQSAGTTLDITVVTQCSCDNLDNLLPLLESWQGPVSVAVFSDNDDIWVTLLELARLRVCYPTIRFSVTFSLVWPVGTAGGLPPKPQILTQATLPCDIPLSPLNVSQQNYAHHRPYPNNLLRNVARKAAISEFVFVIDIDMLPSSNLRQNFMLLASRSRLLHDSNRVDKTVFVVPAFEGDIIPKTKTELVKSVEDGQVRPFYSQLCWKCQAHTDYNTWLNEPMGQILEPIYDVLWKDPWEPFYISRNSVPFYDERFKQYGFNRISQVCELHVAGYKFSVLNNAFIVHLGFKKEGTFHPGKAEELEFNRQLFRQFKMQLKEKYSGSSRRCY